MSADHATVHLRPSVGDGTPAQGLRRWWGLVAIALASDLFIEAIFAGAMLSGAPWARLAHMANATALVAATLVAGVLALITLRRVAHGLPFGLTLLGLGALVFLQTGLGRASTHGAHLLWLHVPLGVALVGVAMQAVSAARRLGAD